jgi:hypothetical protein
MQALLAPASSIGRLGWGLPADLVHGITPHDENLGETRDDGVHLALAELVRAEIETFEERAGRDALDTDAHGGGIRTGEGHGST